VLSEFRARLAVDDQTERLLQQMLARLRERGLLVRGGRQRTDATHVLAAVRELNRLELVTETLRAALEALVAAAGPSGADPASAGLQQYYRDQQGLRWRDKSELPPGALAIGSPYDPEARYGIKRGWAGVATRRTSPRPASPTGPT
jgi:hypothetical protein